MRLSRLKLASISCFALSTSLLLAGCGAEAPTSLAAVEAETLDESVLAGLGPIPALTTDANALNFDGVDDRVSVPWVTPYALGSGIFSISVRAKVDPTRVTGNLIFASSRVGQTDGFLFIGNNGRLLIQMNGAPNFVTAAIPELNDGKFHTFTVTRDGLGYIKFYVDGQNRPATMDGTTTVAQSTRSINSVGRINFGYDLPNKTAFKGAISEVQFFSRALTTKDVTGIPDAANLIGRWVLAQPAYQQITDYSLTKNHGFLGTTATGDSADPSGLSIAAVGTPTIYLLDASDLRVANTCSDVFIDGTNDVLSGTSASSFVDQTKDFYCRNSMENLKKSSNFNLDLTIPIEGIPVKIGGGYSSSSDWQKTEAYCGDKTKTLTRDDATAWVSSTASPIKVNAWLQCLGLNQQFLIGTKTTTQDQRSSTLGLRYDPNKLVSASPKPIVTNLSVIGGVCTPASGGIVVGDLLDSVDKSLSCTKNPADELVVSVSTTYGVYIFDIPGTQNGSAWAVGAVNRQREDLGPVKSTTLTIPSRTCLFGLCSTTTTSTDIWADSGYKLRNCVKTQAFNNTSSSADCTGPYDNDTRFHASLSRSGNHTASYNFVADQYRLVQWQEDVRSNTVSLRSGQAFSVTVSDVVIGNRIVYVTLADGRTFAQNLDGTPMSPFTQVAYVGSTGLTRFYNLTVSF